VNRGALRIILGAGPVRARGWIATQYPEVDITDWQSLSRYFSAGRVGAILAEHVLEHLDHRSAVQAAKNCYRLLTFGGHIRVAVPDGFHPDIAYIEAVRPGGTGAGSDDHKVLYTYRSLSALFVDAGFTVQLLEWFDHSGQFNNISWNCDDGFIQRSLRFDPRNKNSSPAYTSLILDAIKESRRD
jgi:predicted SAM-dependent methyltransferase